MVPVVVVFWAPLPRTVRVSLAEATCYAWLAAASRACRGVSGVLAVLAGPPPDGCPKHRVKGSRRGRIRNRLADLVDTVPASTPLPARPIGRHNREGTDE